MLGKKELVRREEGGLLSPWRPFRELQQDLRELMSTTLEDFFGDGRQWQVDAFGGRGWGPAVDVEESEKEYVFEAELPGLEKNDFKVEMQNGTLIISGERKENVEQKTKSYLRHEQYYGQFRRSFTMPVDANPEGIKAEYKKGILTITVQRLEKAKPKAIPVAVE
ncbi:MAG: Hsp20/alpha crystallin family protein [Elusimicrobia bacterium]|nr:Hsp20/alpha crystallin family protein [Elusimicrobiota bacterium]MDE2236569.1 Hsp20/alpha crystallin family protein [Elusimicrobiota bacterium]MDE2424797.1 Hsp20/alpha crystallin family protein [Elusimicrobiota bacterium]